MAGPSKWLSVIGALAIFSGCNDTETVAEPNSNTQAPDFGPSLRAMFTDPILLTIAAPLETTEYRVDQGYTMVQDPSGQVFLRGEKVGDWGLTFIDANNQVAPPQHLEITHTTSDTIRQTFTLSQGISVEQRAVVATSRVTIFETIVENTTNTPLKVHAVDWMRHCEIPYESVTINDDEIQAEHKVPLDILLAALGPGTYIEQYKHSLRFDLPGEAFSLESCDTESTFDQLFTQALEQNLKPKGSRGFIAREREVELKPGEVRSLKVFRGIASEEESNRPQEDISKVASLKLEDRILDGQKRLATQPIIQTKDKEAELLVHSSFVLLDQLRMPPEGKMKHEYYVFSREPTWWFGRLGIHIHEGFSLVLLAHLNPKAAISALYNFIDRVEPDGYLPYNFGPVVEQTIKDTASAPLFAFVSLEIADATQDDSFLPDAYEAAKKVQTFWDNNRDTDHDGFYEWGGVPVTESLRDLKNVIWSEVTTPDKVEAIDLQAMMVNEWRSLAEIAKRLQKYDEADQWESKAQALSAKINESMWDSNNKFYYHNDRDKQGFTVHNPNDLKRQEIAGFTTLWAKVADESRANELVDSLTDPNRFWRPFGVPGLSAKDAFYSAKSTECCMWNGPVWVPWMWLIQRGLKHYARQDLAHQLVDKTKRAVLAQLVKHHQFREHYSPDDMGIPNNSMPNYNWSALITLMLLEDTDK